MRVMGFACAPGVLRLLGILPGVSGIAFLITSGWMVVGSIIGIKKALNVSNTIQTAMLCVGTWLVSTFVHGVFLVLSPEAWHFAGFPMAV